MTFSKTTEYALRTLTYMASKKLDMYTSKDLYQELKIPKKYLQALLTDLAKDGLIMSIRGRSGGFVLAKTADEIYVNDIIDSVEGFNHRPTCFFGFSRCTLENPCAIHPKWVEAQQAQLSLLSSTKLADLIAGDNGSPF